MKENTFCDDYDKIHYIILFILKRGQYALRLQGLLNLKSSNGDACGTLWCIKDKANYVFLNIT